MPTYQYACTKCGHEFELYQSMKDDPIGICPKDKCVRARWGRGKVKRQVGSGAGLIFKGSGFYSTDYRSEGYKAAAKKDAPPSASSPTSPTPSTGGDSKPAPASPSKPASPPKPTKSPD